jgi:hypothetical protein
LSSDRPTTSIRSRLFYWSAFAFSIFLFAWLLDTSQISSALALLSLRGPSILWALLPYLGVVALETAAWKTILGGLEQPVSFGRLLHIRLATEGVARAIPGGAIAAEGLKLYLVNTYCAVPLSQAAVSLSVLKVLLLTTQMIYVAGGLSVLASREIDTMSGGAALLSAGATAVFLVLAVSLCVFLVRGSAAQTLHRLLMRFPNAALRSWFGARTPAFRSFDQQLKALWSKSKIAVGIASVFLVMSWLGETLETLVVAHLLGNRSSFAEILPLESRVSILRALAFFIPGALGVQDAGYMAAWKTVGFNNVTSFAAAFVLVKRTKEICWIVMSAFLLIIFKSGSLAAQQCRRPSSSAVR